MWRKENQARWVDDNTESEQPWPYIIWSRLFAFGKSVNISLTSFWSLLCFPIESSHNSSWAPCWDETLVKRTLLINLSRASCTNYFMSIHILRFSIHQIKKLLEKKQHFISTCRSCRDNSSNWEQMRTLCYLLQLILANMFNRILQYLRWW